MKPDQARTLLWTFFAGQATPLQKRLLTNWLREPGNDEVYFQALHEWEKAHPQLLPDTDTDWQQLQPRLIRSENPPEILHNEDTGTPSLQPALLSANAFKLRPMARWWLAAASVLLVLTLSVWQRDAILYKTYSTPYGQTRQVDLPDGSRVTLNANSSLQFPRFLALLPAREARLRGEAEFSVVHTLDDRPFLVHTPDGLEVRVLGTEFIVYSRERGSKVVLNRGKITLRSLKTAGQSLAIRPGEVVTIEPGGRLQLRQKQLVADHAAWKAHRFVFDRTALSEIAGQIQERFGVNVLIPDPALAAQQVSGNYPAQTADDLLTMLTQLLNLRADRRDNTIVLQSTN